MNHWKLKTSRHLIQTLNFRSVYLCVSVHLCDLIGQISLLPKRYLVILLQTLVLQNKFSKRLRTISECCGFHWNKNCMSKSLRMNVWNFLNTRSHLCCISCFWFVVVARLFESIFLSLDTTLWFISWSEFFVEKKIVCDFEACPIEWSQEKQHQTTFHMVIKKKSFTFGVSVNSWKKRNIFSSLDHFGNGKQF